MHLDLVAFALAFSVCLAFAKIFRIFWLEMLIYGAMALFLAIQIRAIFNALMSLVTP